MTVRVECLTKHFGYRGDVVGVEGVTFAAKPQAITSLLGPSGSGKSTLLRLVAGLEAPQEGRVWIGEQNVTRTPVRDRHIGFVFQNYALFRHMTVFDNIAFGLKVRRTPKSEVESKVLDLARLVQLNGYEKRLPDELSGGQRQRVALARALASSPRLLLLDEPFGALDTRVRVELREWLHQLHDRTKVTTLLVTHDQEEALELSQYVVLLKDGRIEQAGTPTELYENPKNAFVASFLGGAKVFKGRVQSGAVRFAQQAISTAADYADGEQVEAFVRPHDIRIEKLTGPPSSEPPALVRRLVHVGSFVKLSISLPGEDTLIVHLSRREFQERGIQEGDPVSLDFRDARVARPTKYLL